MCILTLKVVFLFNYWNALDVEVLTCYWLTIVLGLLNKKREGEKKRVVWKLEGENVALFTDWIVYMDSPREQIGALLGILKWFIVTKD